MRKKLSIQLSGYWRYNTIYSMKLIDLALAQLCAADLEAYEELIELWAWYGSCG